MHWHCIWLQCQPRSKVFSCPVALAVNILIVWYGEGMFSQVQPGFGSHQSNSNSPHLNVQPPKLVPKYRIGWSGTWSPVATSKHVSTKRIIQISPTCVYVRVRVWYRPSYCKLPSKKNTYWTALPEYKLGSPTQSPNSTINLEPSLR